MAIPHNPSGSEVVLKGLILLAQVDTDKTKKLLGKGIVDRPIEFADLVACSSDGTDLEDLESVCDDMAEFEAYAWLCKIARELMDPKFIEQSLYLRGLGDSATSPFRIFYDPGGTIGRWISQMTLEDKIIGEFVFSDDFGQTIESPYDIAGKEAK